MAIVVKLDKRMVIENTGDGEEMQIDLVVHFAWREKWPEVYLCQMEH